MKFFLALGVFFVCFETISKLPEWEEVNNHMFNTILHLQNVFSRVSFFNWSCLLNLGFQVWLVW